MATSGTVSTTSYDTGALIDLAFRRCRVPAQTVTPEMMEMARQELFMLLSSLPAYGLQLWATDAVLMPLLENQAAHITPIGTIDVLNVNLRQTIRYTGTNTPAASTYTTDLGSAAHVTTVGIKLQTAGTYALSVSYSSDGVTYTDSIVRTAAAYTTDYTWIDLDPSVSARYWRLTETGGASLNVVEFYLGGNPYETPIARINQDQYTAYSNRTFAGRPNSFWMDRRAEVPALMLWPVPNDDYAANGQLVVWRQRYIMDVGAYQQTIEVPQRWYEAITWQLAWRLSLQPPVDPSVTGLIKPVADQMLQLVLADERDASPMTIVPNIRPYTR